MVEGPHGLEVVLHPMLQLLRHGVQNREVLEVTPLQKVFSLIRVILPRILTEALSST